MFWLHWNVQVLLHRITRLQWCQLPCLLLIAFLYSCLGIWYWDDSVKVLISEGFGSVACSRVAEDH